LGGPDTFSGGAGPIVVDSWPSVEMVQNLESLYDGSDRNLRKHKKLVEMQGTPREKVRVQRSLNYHTLGDPIESFFIGMP
jgi:hypothetical protein